jgi:probable F420-dependent oxidoreductase
MPTPPIRDFRFGFNLRTIRSRDSMVEICRRAEVLGYDVALIPDHLGHNRPAPFPMLVAVAQATDRLRVGTFVLNSAFWNPSLLAREVATTDQLTGGRLELGLGAGHMRSEFEAANIPWHPFEERVRGLIHTIDELDRLFADEASGYQTFQRPRPPLMIAGTSRAVLDLAAKRADIVGYGGILQAPGKPPGTFRLATAEEMDERTRFFMDAAQARAGDIEANLLIQLVAVTDDRAEAGERFRADFAPELSLDEFLAAPVVLIGTVDEIAGQVRERRNRYGISYICVHEPFLEEFAPVIKELRGGDDLIDSVLQ